MKCEGVATDDAWSIDFFRDDPMVVNREKSFFHKLTQRKVTDMSNELANKVAIVTGGAAGIGAATAQQFVNEGARVVIADINPEQGEELAAGLGPDCVFKHVDVASRDDLTDLVALPSRSSADWTSCSTTPGYRGEWYRACSTRTSPTSTG